VAGEVLATEVALAEVGDDGFTGEVGEDETIRVAVRVA
jgi:hypothetical protein